MVQDEHAHSQSEQTACSTSEQDRHDITHQCRGQTTLAIQRSILRIEAQRSSGQGEQEDLGEDPDALEPHRDVGHDLGVRHLGDSNARHEHHKHSRGLLDVPVGAERHHSIAQY